MQPGTGPLSLRAQSSLGIIPESDRLMGASPYLRIAQLDEAERISDGWV